MPKNIHAYTQSPQTQITVCWRREKGDEMGDSVMCQQEKILILKKNKKMTLVTTVHFTGMVTCCSFQLQNILLFIFLS